MRRWAKRLIPTWSVAGPGSARHAYGSDHRSAHRLILLRILVPEWNLSLRTACGFSLPGVSLTLAFVPFGIEGSASGF